MLKTSATYALIATISAASAVTVKDLMVPSPKFTHRAHHVILEERLEPMPDGGLAPDGGTLAYVIHMTAFVTTSGIPLLDGGTGTFENPNAGDCPLTTAAVKAAARTLLTHGANETCR